MEKEYLQQYAFEYTKDPIDEDDILNIYAKEIGRFLLSFSFLESDIEQLIADTVFDDAHGLGITIVEKLNTRSKIDLLHEEWLRISACYEDSLIGNRIKNTWKDLKDLNSFRNSIVHAEWSSISEDNSVRVKKGINRENADIFYKREEISLERVKENVNRIFALRDELADLFEIVRR